MNRLVKWITGLAAVICVLFLGLSRIVMPGLIEQAAPYAEKLAADYVNGSVKIGAVSWPGINTLQIRDITVRDKKQQIVAAIPETRISVNPFKCITGISKAISAVELEKPEIYIRQYPDEKWNYENLLKPSESETTPFYGRLDVHRGTVKVQLPEGNWEYRAEGYIDGSYNPAFDINFAVDAPGMETARVIGSLTNKGVGRLVMKSDRVDLAPYHALALRYGQVKDAAGQVTDIDGEWNNDGKNTVLRGKCSLRDVRGVYQAENKNIPFHVTGRISASDHAIASEGLEIVLDGRKAVISGAVDVRDPDAPKGHLALRSDKITYAGETLADLDAEVVLADKKAALSSFNASYRGGHISGRGVYELESGRITGDADIRKVTLDGDAVSGERFLLNAVLAGNGTYDQEKGSLNLNVAASTMNLQWRDTVLNVMDFDAGVTNRGVEIHSFSASAGDGAMQATGSVTFAGTYDLRGRMANMPAEPVLAAAGKEGKGLVSSSFHLFGNGSDLNFEGPVQIQQAVFKGLNVEEGHGFVTVRNNVAEFNDYRLTMEQGTHVADGFIDMSGNEPRFDLSIETEKVRIEPLVTAAGLQGKIKATGNLTNSMTLTGPLSGLNVEGSVHMSDGSVEGYLINDVSGAYLYKDGELSLRNVIVKALSATLRLHGKMDRERNLDFQASATNVDLSRLPIRDEDLKLGGHASASGTLKGTLDRPLFSGDVTSEEFLLNGVPVKNLTGTMITNGSDINSLKGSCEQVNTDGLTSAYMLDLTLNVPKRDLRGKVGIMYGDLQNILKMARIDFPAKGLAAGTLEFNGPRADTIADFWGYKLDINGVKYDQMALKARLNRGILTIDTARLQEDRAFIREGTIALRGTVNLREKKVQLDARAVDANPAILTAFMQNPPAVSGSLNMTAHLEGTMASPNGEGRLELTNGSVAGVSFDKGTAEVLLENDMFTLRHFSVERDIYKLTATGNVPVDLLRSREKRRNPKAQMNIRVDFNQASLAVLGTHPGIDWALGDTKGNLNIAGTLDNPQLFGSLSVTDGSLKLKDVYTVVDKLRLGIDFNGGQMRVKQLSAVLGKGTLEGSGTYDFKAGEGAAYIFNGNAKNAEIDSAIFKGRLNGSFSLKPEHFLAPRRLLRKEENAGVTEQKAAERKTTEQKTAGAPAMEEGWRPKVTADLQLDDVTVNMPTVPSLGGEGSNIGIDVAVKLGPKIHLYNKYLYDLWLKGGIHARGSTIFPRIEGSIESTKGNVTYLRTQFKVDKASVRWSDRGTFLPYVKLKGDAKFNRYQIAMEIDGPLSKEQLNLKLNSNPPLSQDAIVRMLTLQRATAGSDDVTNEDMYNLLLAGLETGIMGDVRQILRKSLGIDEFRIYIGKLENGVDFDNRIVRELSEEEKDQYNFLIARNLTDRWKVGYTRSFNGRYENFYTQYQMTEHMAVTLSQNENHKRRYSVEYRIMF